MGTRTFALTNFATVVAFSSFLIGCSPDWGNLHVDDAGMIAMTDAGLDAGVSRDGGFDAGPDARVPDSGVMDPDTGIPDGGPPDSGLPDGGVDAGDDAGTDAGTDAGRPPPFHIRFDAATATTGIAFRVVWIEAPPPTRHVSGWYYAACDLAGGTECLADAPELMTGRNIELFPFDASGIADRSACTFATCPSLCDMTTCPGYPASYSFDFFGMPASPVSLVGVDLNGDGTNDSTALSFRLP